MISTRKWTVTELNQIHQFHQHSFVYVVCVSGRVGGWDQTVWLMTDPDVCTTTTIRTQDCSFPAEDSLRHTPLPITWKPLFCSHLYNFVILRILYNWNHAALIFLYRLFFFMHIQWQFALFPGLPVPHLMHAPAQWQCVTDTNKRMSWRKKRIGLWKRMLMIIMYLLVPGLVPERDSGWLAKTQTKQ